MDGRRGEARRVGRPPRQPTLSVASYTLRMTADERADLERAARENGQGLSDFVRDAINEYVADYRERAVFAGSVPRNAATP